MDRAGVCVVSGIGTPLSSTASPSPSPAARFPQYIADGVAIVTVADTRACVAALAVRTLPPSPFPLSLVSCSPLHSLTASVPSSLRSGLKDGRRSHLVIPSPILGYLLWSPV